MHLKNDPHVFFCNNIHCGFASETIEEMRNHLFKHYSQAKIKETNNKYNIQKSEIITCFFCNKKTFHIYNHLKNDPHVFLCNIKNCNHKVKNVGKIKKHLFNHYSKQW